MASDSQTVVVGEESRDGRVQGRRVMLAGLEE